MKAAASKSGTLKGASMSVPSNGFPHSAAFAGSAEDYDSVASAVMETERGRWFLEEFARRNRAADTETVVAALAAMEARLCAGDARAHGSDGAVKAASLLERACARAELMQRVLVEMGGANRQAVRAARLGAEVEGAVRAALAALGAAESDGAAPERAVGSAHVPKALETADFVIAPAEVPASAEPDRTAPREDFAAPPRREQPVPEPVAAVAIGEAAMLREANGAADAPAAAADTHAEAPAAPNPKPTRPGGLPSAWTPGLLENLSEEDRAALFA